MPQLNDPQLTTWAARSGVCLYLWQIAETEEELAAQLPAGYQYLTEARRQFSSTRRRLEWLAARVLLHHVAGVSERLTYLPNGQPAFAHNPQCVSISHTADTVALLLAGGFCGIDVETLSPRAYRLRHHFLTPTEEPIFFPQGVQASCQCSPSSPRLSQASQPPLNLTPANTATLLWSAKEAAFKTFSTRGLNYVTQIRLRPASTSNVLFATCSTDYPAQSCSETSDTSDTSNPTAVSNASFSEVPVRFFFFPRFVLTLCLDFTHSA